MTTLKRLEPLMAETARRTLAEADLTPRALAQIVAEYINAAMNELKWPYDVWVEDDGTPMVSVVRKGENVPYYMLRAIGKRLDVQFFRKGAGSRPEKLNARVVLLSLQQTLEGTPAWLHGKLGQNW